MTPPYELVCRGKRRPSFVPHDLRYFHDHFVGQPLASRWQIPPAKLIGLSYRPADFVIWMVMAPVVSERAKVALADICTGLVEFLPFHPIGRHAYFALNVLSFDEGAPIFKRDPYGPALVNQALGNLLRDHALSGVELGDPADDIMRKAALGLPFNVFPGLVG